MLAKLLPILSSLTLTTLVAGAAVPPFAPLAAPTTLATPTNKPTASLRARCEGGDCTYGGGTETTLQASVVTTTIVSTTSIPCYITTYVTDSTTTTSTVYSTDTKIVTSTLTKEGTVYIYKIKPTPVLMSTTFETTTAITQTLTSFWQTSTGTEYESTVTGETKTINGDVSKPSDHYGDDKGGRSGNKDDGAGKPGTTVQISTAQPTDGSAWTHLAAQDNTGVKTVAGNGAVVAQAATATAANGWAVAAGATAGGGSVVTTAGNGVVVNWNAAGSTAKVPAWSTSAGLAMGMITVMLWDIWHFGRI